MEHISYEQQLALLQLIKAIRAELKPGYSVSMWCGGEICIEYFPRPDYDSRQRYYIKNADEWQALKTRLGL